MLSFTRFGTKDLARATAFYDAIAELLGARRTVEHESVVGYNGPDGVTFLIGKPLVGEASFGNGTQVTFHAPSRAAVVAAHAKALELGGKCEGTPHLRGPEEMGYYSAYFRDLDDNKIMVLKVGKE